VEASPQRASRPTGDPQAQKFILRADDLGQILIRSPSSPIHARSCSLRNLRSLALNWRHESNIVPALVLHSADTFAGFPARARAALPACALELRLQPPWQAGGHRARNFGVFNDFWNVFWSVIFGDDSLHRRCAPKSCLEPLLASDMNVRVV